MCDENQRSVQGLGRQKRQVLTATLLQTLRYIISIIYMLFINMVNFFAPPHWNLRRMRARIFFLSLLFFPYAENRDWNTEILKEKLKKFF